MQLVINGDPLRFFDIGIVEENGTVKTYMCGVPAGNVAQIISSIGDPDDKVEALFINQGSSSDVFMNHYIQQINKNSSGRIYASLFPVA
jgi:hypothetical protein